ncbi:MAG: hypothetical protein R6W90_06280 [Ignavibacteriaceae bacterium]
MGGKRFISLLGQKGQRFLKAYCSRVTYFLAGKYAAPLELKDEDA